MIKLLITLSEAFILAIGLFFAYKWINQSPGDYGTWVSVCALILAFLDFLRRYEIHFHFIKREGIKFTPGELIRHREKLRKQFQEEINKCRSEKLRKDVIIRHVNRMDSYPAIDDKSKGISPWFRVGLLDTYHKGIMIALHYCALSEAPDGYRFTDHKKDEKGDINAYMVGLIPYEYIEEVNFDGDEYYSYPHIFCHFKKNGQPYEEIIFCEEVNMGNGHSYYKEVAKYNQVKENSIY